MKVATYNVESIVENMMKDNPTPQGVTLEEVMETIYSWAAEDFDENPSSLIFQDENGNAL